MNTEHPSIVTLCTGNAARSVMAEFMLDHWAEVFGLDLEVRERRHARGRGSADGDADPRRDRLDTRA